MSFNIGDALTGALGFGGANGARDNMEYLKQIPGIMEGYLNPYTQAGQAAIPGVQETTNNLMTNPSGFVNDQFAEYKPSDYYKFQVGEAEKAAANAGAASGQLGTGDTQFKLADLIQGLASKDQNQYFQNVFNSMNLGLQGQQGLVGMGATAANNLASGVANAYGAMGSTAGAGKEAEGNAFQGLLGGGMTGASNGAFGGGAAQFASMFI